MTAVRRNTPGLTLRMQTALTVSGHTYDELAAISGLAKEAVARWVKALRKTEPAKGIYIERWAADRRGHPVVPVWRWGNQPDAPRPGRALTAAQQMAKLRARRKEERENAIDAPVGLEGLL